MLRVKLKYGIKDRDQIHNLPFIIDELCILSNFLAYPTFKLF